MQEYFSRIEPVLGQGLADKLVACGGIEACGPVVELLAGCRLRRFVWLETGQPSRDLEQALRRHNHFEDGWEFKPFSSNDRPDLLLVGGSRHALLNGLALAQTLKIPALLFGALPGDPHFCSGYEAFAMVCKPDTDLKAEQNFLEQLPETDTKLRPEAIAMVAAAAKALLLSDTPYARPDYNHLFNDLGRTLLLLGHPDWPWQIRYEGMRNEERGTRTEFKEVGVFKAEGRMQLAPTNSCIPLSSVLRPQSSFLVPLSSFLVPSHIAVFGCGGLGSLIAKELDAGGVGKFSLLDSGKVQLFHPVRQFYHTSQLGQPKVYALAESLLGEETFSHSHFPAQIGQPRVYQGKKQITAYNLKLNDNWIGATERLVAGIKPDLAVITTGTDMDFYLARACQRAGIPYLVARCYPRARYFELIFSLPAEATPCFDCLRGHLYLGPQPDLTAEQQARYDSRRATTLESEPATLVETGRAASVAARLSQEILRPQRSAWLQELVAEGQTCLIGANETQLTGEGWAYGLSLPGQVAAFGLAQLFGPGQAHPCRTCGRISQIGNLTYHNPLLTG